MVQGTVNSDEVKGSSVTQPTALFIKGLCKRTVEEHIYNNFSKFGEIVQCEVSRHRSGRSAGFAIITFQRHEDALIAMQNRNNTALLVVETTTRRFISSKKITVTWFNPSEHQSQYDADDGSNGHTSSNKPAAGSRSTESHKQEMHPPPPCHIADNFTIHTTMQSSSANVALCATSGMEAMESLMQLLHAESIQVQSHQRHNTYNCSQSEAGAIHSRTNFNQQPSSLTAMTISEPGGLPLDQNIQQQNQFIASATNTDSATGFGNLQGMRRAERLTANDVVVYESPLCGGVNLMSRCRSMGGAASNIEIAKEQLGSERLQPVHMDELVEEPGRKQQLRKLEPIGPPSRRVTENQQDVASGPLSRRVTENQLHWGVTHEGLPDGFTNSQVPVHGGGLGFEGLQVPLPLKGERKPEAAGGVPVINQLFDQPSLLCAARDLYAAYPARSSIPSTQINNLSAGMHGIDRAALKGANPALCYGTQSTLDQFNLQDEELILRFLEAEEEIPIHQEMHRVAHMQHANRCQQHNAQQQYVLQAMANSASGSSGQQQQQQQLAPFITPELLSEVMWMLESGVNFSQTSPAAPPTAAASPYHQSMVSRKATLQAPPYQSMVSRKATLQAPPYFQRGQNQAQALHQRNMNNHQVPGCYTSGRVDINPHKMYNKGST